jgi:hypothetical protein
LKRYFSLKKNTLFIWLIIRLIQLVFSVGTVFFSHKKSANSVFQPAYNSSRTAPKCCIPSPRLRRNSLPITPRLCVAEPLVSLSLLFCCPFVIVEMCCHFFRHSRFWFSVVSCSYLAGYVLYMCCQFFLSF